jgi:6-pyruvoyltetrahydropterin/6-carboxytetrahydropterin synthase
MKATLCRRTHFNAAHRLYNPQWSDEQNIHVFGKCFNPNYHGHNYELVVKISGEIDPQTGYVIDTKLLKEIVEENIIELLDHKNLNLDVKDFMDLIPTSENISVVIWNILRSKINPLLKLGIVLYETDRNFVEYNGE